MASVAELPAQQGATRQAMLLDGASSDAYRGLDGGEGTISGQSVPLSQLLHAFTTAGTDWRVSKRINITPDTISASVRLKRCNHGTTTRSCD